jgi:excinuclease ABC subunit C
VAAAHVFRVRGGRIRSAKGFVVDTVAGASQQDLVEMILRDGFDEQPPARVVVVPTMPPSPEVWQQLLGERRTEAGEKGSVTLKVAQRGELASLGATVTMNAEDTLRSYLAARTSDASARSRALSEIHQALSLDEAPLRIECFDVSHLGGDNPVASMVVFEDGIPRREHYRKFAITDVRDDTEAIFQVVSRRLARLTAPAGETTNQGFSYPPGLMVIDGGQPQVNAAARALQEAGVSIPVCGLAKKLEEVWVPGADYPIILPRHSEALFLLQRVRDESHRVAITYQRSTRTRTLRSALTDIPGVGEDLAQRLLRHFGSLKRVKAASAEELQALSGVGPELSKRIYTFLENS